MTPERAGQIATHYRRLRGLKVLDTYDFAVLDTLLFRLRRIGHEIAKGSYGAIARLAGISRTKAIESVRKAEQLGLLRKAKHRITVQWGWNRCLEASRQAANTYEFCGPSTEVAGPPVNTRDIAEREKEAANAAKSLAEIAERRTRLLMEWLRSQPTSSTA